MPVYPLPSFVFLALLGSEIAGDIFCPLPGRIILKPFLVRVLSTENVGGVLNFAYFEAKMARHDVTKTSFSVTKFKGFRSND